MTGHLVHYDAACKALAKAVAVDEVMVIRGEAAQLAAAARVANNHKAEADAVALRMRATRRLGQLMQAQKESVGLATGGEHGGRCRIDGSRKDPSIQRPTLAMQGIGKHLADLARVLSRPSNEVFEKTVADVHDKVARAVRNAVREIEIEQERESYRARTKQGGTVADLEALATSGFRAGVICPDFPWEFEAYSSKTGKQRSPERHYSTWPLERILAMAPLIRKLAAENCALLLWAVWPRLPDAIKVIEACGFEYKTYGFLWLKTKPGVEVITLDGDGLFTGMGKTATRSNTESCLLGTCGSPLRLSMDVHQVVIAAVGEHSAKPDEVYRRIERLYGGPYLELFARRPRERWTVWGNEVPAEAALQHGADPESVRRALCRDSHGHPSGPLGAALDILLGDES
jgi:N6-adenosine-specific RNA methylase IME4